MRRIAHVALLKGVAELPIVLRAYRDALPQDEIATPAAVAAWSVKNSPAPHRDALKALTAEAVGKRPRPCRQKEPILPSRLPTRTDTSWLPGRQRAVECCRPWSR
jgi:hypothetical protein